FFITNRVRQRVYEFLACHGVFGVAPVMIPSREARIRTQVLATAHAIDAGSASLAQPCDSNPRSLRKPRGAHTALFDNAHNLVSGNPPRKPRREISFGDVKVGAAHAAGTNSNQNLAGSWIRNGRFEFLKRRRFDERRLMYRHRFQDYECPPQ